LERSGAETKSLPRHQVITLVNAMRDKVKDTFNYTMDSTVFVSVKNRNKNHVDGAAIRFEKRITSYSNILEILYSVDSLQDSLKVSEITAAYQQRLKQELLHVPFDISFADKAGDDNETDFSDVTVGFVHPVTYHLELGNTFPYLVRRLTLPILFSIFLVGVTILSSVLLYKNLLKQRRL